MSVFVTIDSRDRVRATSTISEYTVHLLEDIRDVRAVKIRSIDVPPLWNIPVGRTSVWVSVGGGEMQRVSMVAGDYTTGAAAAPALETALNAQVPALTWTVSADTFGRLTVSANGPFSIRGGDGASRDGYGPSSVGRILGFAAEETASDGSDSLVAAHVNQLGMKDVMYIHLEDFDAIRGTGDGGGDHALDIVNPKGSDFFHDRPAIKEIYPPLSRLSKLKIRILDYYGVPVDFDNREHRIDVEFVTESPEHRTGAGYYPTYVNQ
nr:hypothetical protein TetV2_00168 [Oceanusvirus sp.]